MTTPPRWPFMDFSDAQMAGAIVEFSQEHRFLSNFVGNVDMYGITFRSIEAAFSAAKLAAPSGHALAWLDGVHALTHPAEHRHPDVRASWLEKICASFDIPLPGAGDHARALHIARILFSKVAKPSDAKRAGRKIALRPDWESLRPDGLLEKEWILLTLNRRKYARDPNLARKLLATDDRLILEGNAWGDTAWGVVATPRGLEGFNRMGAISMAVREEMGGAGVPACAISAMPRFAGRGLA